MRVGIQVVPTAALAIAESIVAQAEASGLDAVWVPDHLMAPQAEGVWADVGNLAAIAPSPHIWLEPTTVIAAWAQKTTTIRLGTAVTDTFRRPPAVLAVTALTLSHLTRGRFILGIGAGGALNTVPYGIPFDRPVARLDEALSIIRSLWNEGRVSYEGRFWTLREAVCKVAPFNDTFPEIWIGAEGPRMLELVGRFGDGWMPWIPTTPERYAERLAVVRTAAERAGRDPEAITPALSAFTLLADDHDAAHRMLDSEGWRQIAIGFDEGFFEREGLDHPLGRDGSLLTFVPEWMDAERLRTSAAALRAKLVGHDVVLHGTPADVAGRLRAFAEAGLRHVLINDLTPLCDISLMMDTPRRVAELAKLVSSTEDAI